MLFNLIYEGYDETTGAQHDIHESGKHTFEVSPLQCELFDPAKTALLNSVTISNRSWQRIIQMMSLGHEEFEKKQPRRSGADADGFLIVI